MTIKTIYSALLCLAVLGFASCSSDIENEQTQVVASGGTMRSFTLNATSGPQTRTDVNIDSPTKWTPDDRLIAYNITNPQGYDYLTATDNDNHSSFKGDIHWKAGDELAIFYPYRENVRKTPLGIVPLGLKENTIIIDGKPVTGHQNGTLANFKYFDYMWGKLKNIREDGHSAWTDFTMPKQNCFVRIRVVDKGVKIKDITQVTLRNIYTDADFNLATGEFTYAPKGELTVTADEPLEVFDFLLLPDPHFNGQFEVHTASGKTYRGALPAEHKYERAKYYQFTITVTEPDPFIPIDGVKWGKYNLQYEPTEHQNGWVEGYRLAKNAWDYFYTNNDPFNLYPEFLPRAFNCVAFDHFRWGNIAYAHNYSHDAMRYYSTYTGNIQGQQLNDCYGDLAYYASKGDWKLPTTNDFRKLMAKTGEYLGYYVDNGNVVVGVLFDPTVPENLKGKVLDKNGRVIGRTNQTNAIYVGDYRKENCTRMKHFTKEDIDKGVFLPCAGAYTEYNDGAPRLQRPSAQALYWTSDGKPCDYRLATAFSAYYMTNGCFFPGTVSGSRSMNNPKWSMYSIRPVYAK
ncbi:fimbrillin family protein [Prevotella histicola]|uniref:fimbrillin family protein n=1 Tax=Prevotella histicola TaxID=470565 RepID=UPI001C5EB015|nr:fimbrillin family protein [Prevotella histicola]MBW4739409.1 fimbrillin family protein [Prevotella histicola]MBW4747620.1 fimbrillin family protein [Prevotella histicola]